MIKSTDSSELKKLIKDNKKVLVDCYADWCGPCKMLAPIIEQIAKEEKEIKVYKINIDEDQEIALEYGIMSIPTLLFFVNGKLNEKIIGLRSKSEIIDVISK